MNRYLFLLLFVTQSLMTLAQQTPLFTQYREYGSLINPAMVPQAWIPYEHHFTAGISYRTQWTEIASAPGTAVVRGEFMTRDYSPANAIFGGHIVHDQTGPTGFTGVYGRLAGVISDDPYYGGFGAGMNLGLVQYRVNVSDLRFRDQEDLALLEDQNKLFPDVGIGVYAYKRFTSGFLEESVVYGGVSIPQTLGLDLEFGNENGSFNTQRMQHFYGMLGLYKFFSDGSFIEPSAWVKYVSGAPVNVDFNLRYQMAVNLWIGAGYSTSSSIHLETGVLLGDDVNLGSDHLRIGYGFDYHFTSFGPFTGPAHEVNIAFSLGRF